MTWQVGLRDLDLTCILLPQGIGLSGAGHVWAMWIGWMVVFDAIRESGRRKLGPEDVRVWLRTAPPLRLSHRSAGGVAQTLFSDAEIACSFSTVLCFACLSSKVARGRSVDPWVFRK